MVLSEKRRWLKNRLRKVHWLYNLNMRWKSAAVKRRYFATVAYYTKKKVVKNAKQMMADQLGARLSVAIANGPIRFFYLGTDEQQDRSGILQAIARLGELTWFTQVDGSYGQMLPRASGIQRSSNAERLLDLFHELSRVGKVPNILFAQTWAAHIDPRVLGEIRERHGTVIINIAMDDRHQYWGQKVKGEWRGTYGLIPYIDLTLTSALECVDWYLKEECPAIFFPEASDPNIFRAIPNISKIHDICFVGGRYGIREEIVCALREAGISVVAYGSGWENGRLETKEVPRLFAQSKIVLGIGAIGHCSDLFALKMRDFDGPMSGSLYMTHDNPDLYQMYDVGKEIVTYCNIDECIRKAGYYITHDREREKIARAGMRRVIKEHSWDRRFKDIIEWLAECAYLARSDRPISKR